MTWLEELAIVASVAVALTGALLILSDNRRLLLATLAAQYVFAAWLVSLSLPLQVAAAKLVAGLLACAIIAVALANVGWSDQFVTPETIPSSMIFRIIAVCLVLLVAFGLGGDIWSALPKISTLASYGATFLIAMGLLQLGFQEEPVKVGIGLLTIISGFEVAYTTIEPSLAVMALLATVHLGIAVVVSHLLLIGSGEKPRLEG
ncbi:MAG: hypothetical protein AMJ88_00410 [Anaerolineae bacterium SM23_ 63]|nr:MAG: hypothetical protein AMJ88_00410 [Anaerolineae bacterium SM23_ 63]HEY47235.1 hypothetical protein [Anaerolineae bacterium]